MNLITPTPSPNPFGSEPNHSMSAPPPLPDAFLHPAWGAVIPPSHCRSHPIFFSPLPAPIPRRKKSDRSTTPLKKTAFPSLPSPDTSSEASGSTGRSQPLVASEIFFTGDGEQARRRTPDSPKGEEKESEKVALEGKLTSVLDRYVSAFSTES